MFTLEGVSPANRQHLYQVGNLVFAWTEAALTEVREAGASHANTDGTWGDVYRLCRNADDTGATLVLDIRTWRRLGRKMTERVIDNLLEAYLDTAIMSSMMVAVDSSRVEPDEELGGALIQLAIKLSGMKSFRAERLVRYRWAAAATPAVA